MNLLSIQLNRDTIQMKKKSFLSAKTILAEINASLVIRTLFSFSAFTLVASPLNATTPSQNYQVNISHADEIETLKQQLVETTRQLHEYKAHLFRSSHPQDTAKINALTRKIAEQDESNIKLTETLTQLQNDILQARKQSNTLEITADALSAMVQAQRVATESLEKDFASKQEHLSKELETAQTLLATEKQLTEQVNSELAAARESLASYDKRMQELEINHAAAIANTEAIYSQLELATRQHDESHQHLHSAVNDLQNAKNALFIELTQLKKDLEDHVASNESLKQDLNEAKSRHEIQYVRSQKLETDLQDSMLESTMLKFQLADLREKMSQSEAIHIFSLEDTSHHLHHLSMAMDYADALKTNHVAVQSELSQKHQQDIKKHILKQNSLKGSLLDKEEALTAAVLYYQLTIDELEAQEKSLKDSLAQAESHQCFLEDQLHAVQNSHREETKRAESLQEENHHLKHHYEKQQKEAQTQHQNLLNHHASLKNDLEEKEAAFTTAALNYLSMLDDYRRQVDAVEEKLSQSEQMRSELQQQLEHIHTTREGERKHLETLLAEKEQLDAIYHQQQAEAVALQQKIDLERSIFENDLLERERALTAASIHYITTLDDYRKQVGAVEDRLADSEKQRSHLHEKLHSTETAHSEATNKENQLLAEIASLKQEIENKNADLNVNEQHLHSINNEHQNQLAKLNSQLAHAQEEHTNLKNELRELQDSLEKSSYQIQALQSEKHDISSSTEQHSLQFKTTIDHLNDEIASLKTAMSVKDNQLAILEKQSADLTSTHQLEMQKIENVLLTAEKNIVDLQNQLEKVLAESNKNTHQSSTLHSEKVALENALEDQRKKTLVLQSKLNEGISSLHSIIESKENQLSTIEKQLNEQKSQNQSQLNDLESRLAQAQNHSAELQIQLEQAQTLVDAEKQNVITLKKTMNETSTAISELKQSHENEINKMHEAFAALETQLSAEKEMLTAKLEEQREEAHAAQKHLQALARKQALSSEQISDLEDHIQQLNSNVESKDHELLDAMAQLKELKSTNSILHEELAKASRDSSNAEEHFAALRLALATTQTDITALRLSSTSTIDKLQAQLNENKHTIASLIEDNNQLSLEAYNKIEQRKKEYEDQLQALSALADKQDRSLTEAGEAIQKTQEYNHQLAQENVALKEKLTRLETAERSLPSKKEKRDAITPLIGIFR